MARPDPRYEHLRNLVVHHLTVLESGHVVDTLVVAAVLRKNLVKLGELITETAPTPENPCSNATPKPV